MVVLAVNVLYMRVRTRCSSLVRLSVALVGLTRGQRYHRYSTGYVKAINSLTNTTIVIYIYRIDISVCIWPRVRIETPGGKYRRALLLSCRSQPDALQALQVVSSGVEIEYMTCDEQIATLRISGYMYVY